MMMATKPPQQQSNDQQQNNNNNRSTEDDAFTLISGKNGKHFHLSLEAALISPTLASLIPSHTYSCVLPGACEDVGIVVTINFLHVHVSNLYTFLIPGEPDPNVPAVYLELFSSLSLEQVANVSFVADVLRVQSLNSLCIVHIDRALKSLTSHERNTVMMEKMHRYAEADRNITLTRDTDEETDTDTRQQLTTSGAASSNTAQTPTVTDAVQMFTIISSEGHEHQLTRNQAQISPRLNSLMSDRQIYSLTLPNCTDQMIDLTSRFLHLLCVSPLIISHGPYRKGTTLAQMLPADYTTLFESVDYRTANRALHTISDELRLEMLRLVVGVLGCAFLQSMTPEQLHEFFHRPGAQSFSARAVPFPARGSMRAEL